VELARPARSGRREESARGMRPAGRPARVAVAVQIARLALTASLLRGIVTLGGQAIGFGLLEAESRPGAIALPPVRAAQFAERRVEPH